MGRAINKTVTIVELIKVFHLTSFSGLFSVMSITGALSSFFQYTLVESIVIVVFQRRIVGLHQITSIGSTDITDTWEPLEEGLLP